MFSVAVRLPRTSGASQKVSYTGTAGSSSALPQGTTGVLCYCSTAAYIKVGWGASSVSATAADLPVPANTFVLLEVPKRGPNDAAGSDQAFVSAIQDAAGGNLFVQPVQL